MANRRMFSKDVIDSDRFLDMPPTAQNLYFHLGIQADDDGFVSSPKKVKRACGSADDDLKLLEAKNFIISFKSGVVVITEWKLNNYIQKDRYTSTIHLEEKKHILTTENRSYQYVDTPCIQDVSEMDSQYSIEQNSIGEVRKGKGSKAKDSKAKKSIEQISLDQSSLEDKKKFSTDAFENSLNFIDCTDLYENEFGELGRIDKNTLERLGGNYGIDFLYEAILKAISRDDVKTPLGYITYLLKEWQQKGFTSVEEIELEQEEFNEQFELE